MSLTHIRGFYRPASLSQAIRELHRVGRRGRLLAGGTDLAVHRDSSVRFLVDLSQLGLNYVKQRGAGWAVGATTTISTLEEMPALQVFADGILAATAKNFGSKQIRNVATVGGNLVNASPQADLVAPLLVLDARVSLQSDGRSDNA